MLLPEVNWESERFLSQNINLLVHLKCMYCTVQCQNVKSFPPQSTCSIQYIDMIWLINICILYCTMQTMNSWTVVQYTEYSMCSVLIVNVHPCLLYDEHIYFILQHQKFCLWSNHAKAQKLKLTAYSTVCMFFT